MSYILETSLPEIITKLQDILNPIPDQRIEDCQAFFPGMPDIQSNIYQAKNFIARFIYGLSAKKYILRKFSK